VTAVDTPESINGSKDGQGAGDRDQRYAWGQPKTYLTTMQEARLLVMRGLVMDTRRGAHGNAADGDISSGHLTPAGLWVPD
jgi:hypothetical protein